MPWFTLLHLNAWRCHGGIVSVVAARSAYDSAVGKPADLVARRNGKLTEAAAPGLPAGQSASRLGRRHPWSGAPVS